MCAHDRDPSESAQQTGFAAEHTATAGLYLVIFFAHCLCDLPPSCLYRGKLAVRFVGLVRSVGRSPSLRTDPRNTNPPGSCLLPLTDISDRRIYVKAKSHCVQSTKKERWIKGFFFLLPSVVASALLQKLSVARHMVPFVQKAQ